MLYYECNFCPIPKYMKIILFLILISGGSFGYFFVTYFNYGKTKSLRDIISDYREKFRYAPYSESYYNSNLNIKEKAIQYLKTLEENDKTILNSYELTKEDYYEAIRLGREFQDNSFRVYSRIKALENFLADLGFLSFFNEIGSKNDEDEVDIIYDIKITFAFGFFMISAIALYVLGGLFLTCNCQKYALEITMYYVETSLYIFLGFIIGGAFFSRVKTISMYYLIVLLIKKVLILGSVIGIFISFYKYKPDYDPLYGDPFYTLKTWWDANKKMETTHGIVAIVMISLSIVGTITFIFFTACEGCYFCQLFCSPAPDDNNADGRNINDGSEDESTEKI